MNNTFTFYRFGLLLKRQWLEFAKIYLISLVVIVGVITCFYGANLESATLYGRAVSYNGYYDPINFRVPLFLVLGFIFISVIASGYFASLGQKPKAIIELMAPASTLEKFLCAVTYTSLFSVMSFVLVFYFIDMLFVQYINGVLAEMTAARKLAGAPIVTNASVRLFFTQYLTGGFRTSRDTNIFYVLPTLITSVFLLGSVYFNRFHYIKTAVGVMSFVAILAYCVYKFSKWITGDLVRKMTVNNSSPDAKDPGILYVMLLLGAITLIFWGIGYMRLKEKEV